MTTNREQLKRQKRQLRHSRVRSTVTGTTERPRLAVFRSSSHIYAQLIDDSNGKTLVSASSAEIKDKAAKSELSTKVGAAIAEKAKGQRCY
jgi:large subunit ribosomal protein L18